MKDKSFTRLFVPAKSSAQSSDALKNSAEMGNKMREQLNQDLHTQLEGMQNYRSYQNKIDALNKELEKIKKEIADLETAQRKEDKDVERLEKGGLQAFYLKMRGKYEATMDKEVLEAAAAKVKLENKQYELEQRQQSIRNLKMEQSKFAGCEKLYQELYQQKLEELMAEDSPSQREILELKTKITESEHNIKELKEAIDAGNDVLKQLEVVMESLQSAENWGTWDILGGGFMSDVIKHSHLDDAKDGIQELEERMSAFHTELADVNLSMEIRIDTDGFSKFADFFFDGLFADLNMQSRIQDSIEDVEESQQKVTRILNQMQKMCASEQQLIARTEKQITEVVNDR